MQPRGRCDTDEVALKVFPPDDYTPVESEPYLER